MPCHCFALRQATRVVSQFYDQRLAPAGLRTTQFSLLSWLKYRGPCTINQLAAQMVMDRTTLGRNLRPLERDGLLRLEVDADDRRARKLALTEEGQARLAAARPLWLEAQREFEAAYGAPQVAALRAALDGLVATRLDQAA